MQVNAIIGDTRLDGQCAKIFIEFVVNGENSAVTIPLSPVCGESIDKILGITDASAWELIKGKAIRFEFDEEKKLPIRIGHIVYDNWISFINKESLEKE